MQRVVVLGGGVGGTLAANLIARKLKKPIANGEAAVTVVDATGRHAYQPGYMYIALGHERPEKLVRPEKSLLDANVNLVVDDVARIDVEAMAVELASGERLRYDQLVIATGSRIVPEEMEHFDEEAHHFYTPEASARLRAALDAFTGGRIVIGIAGIPYKCPPAPLEVAFLIESELRARGLREKTDLTFLSPVNRAFTIESVSDMATPILEEKGIHLELLAGIAQIDPERKVAITDAFEEHPYDLLIVVPPHRGAQVVIDSGLAPKSGWLPTDRHTLQVKTVAKPAPGVRRTRTCRATRTSTRSATPRTCRCPRPAARPTSRPRSSPSGSPRPSSAGGRAARTPATPARSCASSRSATARARCSSSTTTIRRSRRSRTSCGTSARSRSTRPTGTPCRRVASRVPMGRYRSPRYRPAPLARLQSARDPPRPPRPMTGRVFRRADTPNPPVAVEASGSTIVDADGREYLDAAGGAIVVNVGHGRREIADVIADQAATLAYAHGSAFTTEPLERYAAAVGAHLPMDDPAIYPVSGGSEAMETALKLARATQLARGETERWVVFARWGSYHGNTLGALDLSGRRPLRRPYEGWLGRFRHVSAAYPYRGGEPGSQALGSDPGARRRAGSRVHRRRSRHGRRVRRRADRRGDARCRRAAAGLLAGDRRRLPPARRPAHRGRGDDGLRPDRRLVRPGP